MKLIRAIIILFTEMKHIISLEKPVEISSFKPQLVFLLKFKKVYHDKGQKSLTDSIDFHVIHLAVIVRPIIYFDTKTENKLVNSTQLCMYLVCIHTILTKTKIIFIAVNTSRRGGKTTSHVFVLNITFMIGPVQNMCVCKIWYYYYARLWLFMYQDWRTNCYYIKTIYQENVTTYYLVVDMRTKRPSSFFLGTQCHDLGLQLSGCSFSGLQNQIKCLMFFLVFWKEEGGYCSASKLLCTRLSVLGKVYRLGMLCTM